MSFPAAPPTSKPMARRGLAVAGGVLLGLAVTSAASAATTAGSVSQALKHSLNDASETGSARITVQFFSGSTTGKVVQDSSLHSGEQTVAIKNELASVILVDGTAYISGNSGGLTSYFGLPSAQVSTLEGKWISVESTDAAFPSVSANVALGSALANVTPSGTLVAGKRSKVDHQWVNSISGKAPGGAGRLTLFLAANSQVSPWRPSSPADPARRPEVRSRPSPGGASRCTYRRRRGLFQSPPFRLPRRLRGRPSKPVVMSLTRERRVSRFVSAALGSVDEALCVRWSAVTAHRPSQSTTEA